MAPKPLSKWDSAQQGCLLAALYNVTQLRLEQQDQAAIVQQLADQGYNISWNAIRESFFSSSTYPPSTPPTRSTSPMAQRQQRGPPMQWTPKVHDDIIMALWDRATMISGQGVFIKDVTAALKEKHGFSEAALKYVDKSSG
ncbi:hypothetical protein GGR56DRAFT_668766 [Xylariaceae sp. FL0804]|nr:hypothetical protein GGR56DRAFT_668766 [Xylariaceae sp. FL0804]